MKKHGFNIFISIAICLFVWANIGVFIFSADPLRFYMVSLICLIIFAVMALIVAVINCIWLKQSFIDDAETQPGDKI